MLRGVLFALALAVPGWAVAQTAPSVADHENWSVFTVAEPKQCFIASRAAETTVTRNGQPSTAKRGEPVLHVTHTPSAGADDVVSAFFGFPPDPVQSIELRIGSDSFTLLAGKDGLAEWGWSQPGDDANAVSALRAGNVATVTTLSRTGKTIVDSYSLKGFTAALEDARARCAG